MKEFGVRLRVEMYKYIKANPDMIVNGFITFVITTAFQLESSESMELDEDSDEFEDDMRYTD